MNIKIENLNKVIFSNYHNMTWKKSICNKFYYKDIFEKYIDDQHSNLKYNINNKTQKYINNFKRICESFGIAVTYKLSIDALDTNKYRVAFVISKSDYENIILPITKYLDDKQLKNISDIKNDPESIEKFSEHIGVSFDICSYIIHNIANNCYVDKILNSRNISKDYICLK